MTQKPLIVRVALAQDWVEAYRSVWIETFKSAAANMGLPVNEIAIETRGISEDR